MKRVRHANDIGVPTSVFLPGRLRVALDRAAHRENISRSELASRAIAKEIGFARDGDGKPLAKSA